MGFAVYGGRTQAGIERIARERKVAALAAVQAALPEPEAQPVVDTVEIETVPETAEIIRLKTPLMTIREMIAKVGAEHDVSLDEILGPRRSRHIVKARFAAVAAVYKAYPCKSLIELGQIFNRDHTSILHSLRVTGVYK